MQANKVCDHLSAAKLNSHSANWPCSNHSAHSNVRWPSCALENLPPHALLLCSPTYPHLDSFIQSPPPADIYNSWPGKQKHTHTHTPLPSQSLSQHAETSSNALVSRFLSKPNTYHPLHPHRLSRLFWLLTSRTYDIPSSNPLTCVSQSPLVLCVHGRHR